MKTREYKEATMSPIVTAWLEGMGYTVYAEVGGVDLVGVNWANEQTIAVELKCSLTEGVIRQAGTASVYYHKAYACVLTKPKLYGRVLPLDIGILRCINGNVRVLKEPSQSHAWEPQVKQEIEKLRNRTPGGVGGMPNVLGVGPAQQVKTEIAKYLEGKPDASWKEMFENIPNHYSSFRSMQGAMRTLAMWEAVKRRRKEEKEAQRKHVELLEKLASRSAA